MFRKMKQTCFQSDFFSYVPNYSLSVNIKKELNIYFRPLVIGDESIWRTFVYMWTRLMMFQVNVLTKTILIISHDNPSHIWAVTCMFVYKETTKKMHWFLMFFNFIPFNQIANDCKQKSLKPNFKMKIICSIIFLHKISSFYTRMLTFSPYCYAWYQFMNTIICTWNKYTTSV